MQGRVIFFLRYLLVNAYVYFYQIWLQVVIYYITAKVSQGQHTVKAI